VGDRSSGALEAGVRVELLDGAPAPDDPRIALVVAGSRDPGAERILRNAGVSIPDVPEALGLARGGGDDDRTVLACGSDQRGLVYAVLELTDRVAHAPDPLEALAIGAPIVEQRVIRSKRGQVLRERDRRQALVPG
jgi:hypothetical protein